MNRQILPMQGRGGPPPEHILNPQQHPQPQHPQSLAPQQQQQQQQQSPLDLSPQQQQGPLTPGRGGGVQGSGGSGGGAGGSAEKPTYAKRGKITIVACVPCRRRKTKCDGKRPSCSQCDARDGQCSYDMTDDQRKLTVLRDNVEQLQEKSNSLGALLHTIQRASEAEAAEIYRRLRSGLDVQMVAEHVAAGQMLSGVGGRMDPQLEMQGPYGPLDITATTRVQQYDNLMVTIAESEAPAAQDIVRRIRHQQDVSQILSAVRAGEVESRPLISTTSSRSPSGLESDFSQQHQVFGLMKGPQLDVTHARTAQQSPFHNPEEITQSWTLVTRDKDLIEHLIELYFTWQHCFFQSFPEKLFREDMQAGRTKYCSTILVNAICAAGCFFSDRSEVLRDMGNGRRLVAVFYDEAVRLLGQGPRPSVTNTAALFLICYVEGTRGDLSNLWCFSGRSALMAMDLGLHLKPSSKRSGSEEDQDEREKESKARLHAFWGSFHVDQLTAFTLGRLPILNGHGVTSEWPAVDKAEDELPWSAYGMEMEPKRGARGSVFRYCAMLSSLINSTLLMFFAPTMPLSGSILLEEYEKYLAWKRDLPEIVAHTDNAPPHVLTLHMYYHAAVLLIFRPFLKATLHDSDTVPREVCRASANAISELWIQHCDIYGLTGIYMFQVHCLLTACTIHIIGMPNIADTRHFTRACDFFQKLIGRNEWARSSLNILRGLVEKWKLILPREAEEALYRDQHDKPSTQAEFHSVEPGSTPSDMMGQSILPQRHPASAAASSRSPSSAELTAAALVGTYSAQPPAKRSSTGTGPIDPSLEQQGASGVPPVQKRQRVGRSHPNLNPIRNQESQEQPGSPSQYIYSPLGTQQAPMLAPARAGNPRSRQEEAESASEEPASGGSAESLATAAIGAAESAQAAPAPSQQQPQPRPQQGQRGQQSQRGSSSGQRRKKRSQRGESSRAQAQGAEGVEGMSFEEDWRDPFMGYLGD